MLKSQDSDTVAAVNNDISFSEIINIEMRLLRAELNQLQEEQNELIASQGDRVIDRIGALDQRMLTLENRLNSIYRDMDQLESNFTIAMVAMVVIALLTVISVFIMRKKMIDPVALQTARLKADLQTSGANELRQALREMAKDDPYLAQILNKHNLD